MHMIPRGNPPFGCITADGLTRTTINVNRTSSLLCEGTVVINNNMVVAGGTRGNMPFHCASSWALACLYMDTFCTRLSKATERLVTKYAAEMARAPARRPS